MIASRDQGESVQLGRVEFGRGPLGGGELNRIVAPRFLLLDELDAAGQALAAIKVIEALEILVPGDRRIADRCGYPDPDRRGPQWLVASAPRRAGLACAARD